MKKQCLATLWILIALTSPGMAQYDSRDPMWAAVGCWSSTQGNWNDAIQMRTDSLWLRLDPGGEFQKEAWNRPGLQAKDSIAGIVLKGRWSLRPKTPLQLELRIWQSQEAPRGPTEEEHQSPLLCQIHFPNRYELSTCCSESCTNSAEWTTWTRSTQSGCPR
jgi:hypothetical protein